MYSGCGRYGGDERSTDTKMATKIRIPSRVVEVLEKPIERTAVELMVIGLYRDGKITLRQAADLVSVDAKHETLNMPLLGLRGYRGRAHDA